MKRIDNKPITSNRCLIVTRNLNFNFISDRDVEMTFGSTRRASSTSSLMKVHYRYARQTSQFVPFEKPLKWRTCSVPGYWPSDKVHSGWTGWRLMRNIEISCPRHWANTDGKSDLTSCYSLDVSIDFHTVCNIFHFIHLIELRQAFSVPHFVKKWAFLWEYNWYICK